MWIRLKSVGVNSTPTMVHIFDVLDCDSYIGDVGGHVRSVSGFYSI